MNPWRECNKCRTTWKSDYNDWNNSGETIIDICDQCHERRRIKDEVNSKLLIVLDLIQRKLETLPNVTTQEYNESKH